MDFWSSVKVLAKRWYIVAIGLALTLAVAVGVNFLIEPSYTAAGSVVLAVPPNLPDRAESANPYLAYGNLEVAAKVVASAMNQPSVVREQKAKGASGTFVVDLDPERSSPIITVDSRADSAAAAIRTVEVVTAGVQQLLADRQRALGAPQNTWITAATVVVPEEANRAVGSRLRAISAVAVLGAVATLSLAFAVEGWSQGRRRETAVAPSRGGGTPPQPVAAPPAPTPPPAPAPSRNAPPAPSAAPAPAPAPAGACPLCGQEFRTALALAGHLEDEHDLTNGPPARPATAPAPSRRPVPGVDQDAAPRARAPRPGTDGATAPAEPVTRARVAKKAAAPKPTVRKSPPPTR